MPGGASGRPRLEWKTFLHKTSAGFGRRGCRMSSPEKADVGGVGMNVEGDLNALRMDEVRKAIEIYLSIAYSGVEAPESVRGRLRWPEEEVAATLLANPPFERVGRRHPRTDDLRVAFGERALSTHEAANPTLAERGRFFTFGQHARPSVGARPERAADSSAFGALKPRINGSRRRSRTLGTPRACRRF